MKKQITYLGNTFTAKRIKELTMNKINEKSTTTATTVKNRRSVRRIYAFAIAAAATLSLAVTAYATNNFGLGGFAKSAFGNGIEGFETEAVDNGKGGTYEAPAVERVEVDPAEAEKIIGDYVANANKTVTAHGYTFTIEDYVMDKNGIAVVTYTVENPDGLGDIFRSVGRSGVTYYSPDYDEMPADYTAIAGLSFKTDLDNPNDYAFLDDRTFLDQSLLTDTKATLVVYMTPFDLNAANKDLIIEVDTFENAVFDAVDTITLPQSERITPREFTGENFKVSVSAIGTMSQLTPQSEYENMDAKFQEVVINYKDGTQYVLNSNNPNVYNTTVGSLGGDNMSILWNAFNRLVDIENIESISFDGDTLLP